MCVTAQKFETKLLIKASLRSDSICSTVMLQQEVLYLFVSCCAHKMVAHDFDRIKTVLRHLERTGV